MGECSGKHIQNTVCNKYSDMWCIGITDSPHGSGARKNAGNLSETERLYHIGLIDIWGNHMADLPKSVVVRLAKQAGAERVSEDAATALVVKAEDYIKEQAKQGWALALHAKRKTLKAEDLEVAAAPAA